MCSLTIEVDDRKLEAFDNMLSERGLNVSEWALSLMESDFEDYELSKLADEAYDEYLKDPVTYSLEEVIRMNGDDDLLGDA